MGWNFMAVQAIEIGRKLLIKVRFIAFMLMKRDFLTFYLKPLIRKKMFAKQTSHIGKLPAVFTVFVCSHTTNKLFWISHFKYVHKGSDCCSKSQGHTGQGESGLKLKTML